MSHKTLRDVAIVIIVVFALTIIVYHLIFGTDPNSKSGPPVELELGK